METKVLNFFGGPGVGKSTIAAGVFHYLKKNDMSCEYVSEYAKDLVWEEIPKLLQNQIHVFSEQFRRQFRLVNKVDFIITDSPILLSSVYYKYYTSQLEKPFFSKGHIELTCEFFDKTFLEFENVNFVLRRTKGYVPSGRLQTEDQAKIIDQLVINKLKEMNETSIIMDYEKGVESVLFYLESNFKE